MFFAVTTQSVSLPPQFERQTCRALQMVCAQQRCHHMSNQQEARGAFRSRVVIPVSKRRLLLSLEWVAQLSQQVIGDGVIESAESER